MGTNNKKSPVYEESIEGLHRERERVSMRNANYSNLEGLDKNWREKGRARNENFNVVLSFSRLCFAPLYTL